LPGRAFWAGGVEYPASGNADHRTPCHPGLMLRCLIVDDNRRFLEAARGLLESQGMVVGVASTGADAFSQVERLRPDVALLDIDLGGESGFELARRLDRDAGETSPRTILISTHAEEDYTDLIESSPAIGFISKSALSAAAVQALLDRQEDGEPECAVKESR
jgi:CheY-like chemotaxis protein